MNINNINNFNNSYIASSSLEKHENTITADEYQKHFELLQSDVKICSDPRVVVINKEAIYNKITTLISYLSGDYYNQDIEQINQIISNHTDELTNLLVENCSNDQSNILISNTSDKCEQIVANVKKYILEHTNIDVSINDDLDNLVSFAIMSIIMDEVTKKINNIQQDFPVIKETLLNVLHTTYNNFIQRISSHEHN